MFYNPNPTIRGYMVLRPYRPTVRYGTVQPYIRSRQKQPEGTGHHAVFDSFSHSCFCSDFDSGSGSGSTLDGFRLRLPSLTGVNAPVGKLALFVAMGDLSTFGRVGNENDNDRGLDVVAVVVVLVLGRPVLNDDRN